MRHLVKFKGPTVYERHFWCGFYETIPRRSCVKNLHPIIVNVTVKARFQFKLVFPKKTSSKYAVRLDRFRLRKVKLCS